MADPKKVSFAQLRVGIMAIAAMTIAGVLIFLLTGTKNLFRATFQLRTFMDDSSGMTENAPVRLNGIPIGEVDALKLSGQKDPQRIVEVDMEIRSSFMAEIPKDSRAGIAASNLLGDKFINITKGTKAEHVQPGDEIASVPNQDIPELMAQSAMRHLALRVLCIRYQGGRDRSSQVGKASAVTAEITQNVNSPPTGAKSDINPPRPCSLAQSCR